MPSAFEDSAAVGVGVTPGHRPERTRTNSASSSVQTSDCLALTTYPSLSEGLVLPGGCEARLRRRFASLGGSLFELPRRGLLIHELDRLPAGLKGQARHHFMVV
ncbi:hypothetical protein PCANC_05404 [Puccinia coronata f. sp. avenae]|uniref:Uncharacterized protein n=1 Tax=Puccinia coronata f. sp. avenae TaxID=200324 RepID=A0A2N5T6S1_9BASI|nr:hypothetical protein PCASD_19640 [Puccinia coronata f. sp. avenae]PLW21197.1 hypothetical protein PCANC_05404 [Puccinia coronata f. sp. avenae]PLW46262.1 hypothetical protein PCASD_03791 [Puccinia coronata f. sp. avenae]